MSKWVVVCVTHHKVANGIQPMQETSVYGMFERRLDAAMWDQQDHGLTCPGEHYYWVINDVQDPGRGPEACTIHDDPLKGKGAAVPYPRQPLGLEQAGLMIRV